MNREGRLLWFGNVYDDEEVNNNKYASFAANNWQSGFISALRSHNIKVIVVSFDSRPYFDPIFVGSQKMSIVG